MYDLNSGDVILVASFVVFAVGVMACVGQMI